MNIGLITYTTGHLKTFQLAWRLALNGHAVTLFAFPFVRRPVGNTNGRWQDRPVQLLDLDPKELAAAHGWAWREVKSWRDDCAGTLAGCEVYLTCIAKIIPEAFIGERKILNCHPGLLPFNRGVDAWKRAIVKGWPVGVTLHQIDGRIDGGLILARARVPVLATDSLADVAQRSYEAELHLMSNFDRYLGNADNRWPVDDEWPVSHELISDADDRTLVETFETNRGAINLATTLEKAFPHPADAAARHAFDWEKKLF